MTAGPDRWIRWTTIGCVALLALIAGTVSYLHMHLGWWSCTGSQKARNRLVGPVSGRLMPGEGRPAIGVRFCFGEVAGCAGGHARGRRLRRGVRRPTGATAGSAMNGCRRRLR